MINPVQAVSSDWVVFIDGVQVPFLGIVMSTFLDQIATVSIDLEPDYAVTLFRPGAVVAVFCRDEYDGKTFASRADELLDGFVYFAGGELASIEDAQEPQARYQRLVFKADIDHLARHSAFASGAGGNAYYGYIVGSRLLNFLEADAAAPRQDLLSFSTLAAAFAKGSLTDASLQHRSSGQNSDDFGLRMLRLTSYLCAHNASLRLQAVRSRLANKLCAIDDLSLGVLASVAVGTPLFSGGQRDAGASGSIWDIIQSFEARVGYRMATIFAPAYPKDQPAKGKPLLVPFPPGIDKATQIGGMSDSVSPRASGESDDLFKLRVDWFRNDYVFLPNLFYSAPPPCNLIFPDMLTSRRTIRSFATEPTRSVFVDSSFVSGAGLVFVEAPGLTSDDLSTLLTPDNFWANFKHLVTPTSKAPTESAWQAPVSADDPGANNLKLVTDDEAERGVVVSWQRMDYEYMLALARSIQIRNPDGSFNQEDVDKLRAQLQAGDNPYCLYVQEWLRYQHQLKRWARPSSISLRGHRWIVPGFSTVIFGDRVSYVAYVTGVVHTVTADGSESSSVSIDHARPLGSVNVDVVRAAEAVHADAPAATQSALSAVHAAHEKDVAALRLSLREAQAAAARGDTASEASAAADVMRRATACALVVSGVERTVAGALTAKNDPDLAARFSARLSNPPPSNSANAATALRDVIRFYDLQERQAAENQPAHGATPESARAISSARITLAQEGAKIEAIAARLERDADFPTPPKFYNKDLIRLRSLDDHYVRLLGCAPLYTGDYAANVRPPADGSPYGYHVSMLQVLSSIFPAVSSALPADLRPSPAASSWDDVRASSADGIGTQRWQHEKFLRRRAQSMREYLTTHGFRSTLAEVLSDEPSPTVFYSMTPVPSSGAPSGPSVDGLSYGWDDSVLCRLVDEVTRSGESLVGDALMRERRAAAKSFFLTSGARQALVLAYSRKHFGSRGFSGE